MPPLKPKFIILIAHSNWHTCYSPVFFYLSHNTDSGNLVVNKAVGSYCMFHRNTQDVAGGGEKLLKVEHEVPVSDVWIAAAPTSYSGSKNLVDDTTDLSILIGWPIINVKFIFKSQNWKEDFLDNFFKCYEDAMRSDLKFLRVPNHWNEMDVYQYLPLIVHNEFTSKLGPSSNSPVDSNASGGSGNQNQNLTYSPVVSEIHVGISTRVDEVIDDTCQFSSHVPCCAWVRFGKKDSDCYLSLHG